MRLFGTDGIRGKAGRYPLDPETVEKLAVSAAAVLKKQHLKPVVIMGRDTRESGEQIAAALKKGFINSGIDVWDVGIIPTPGISCLVKKYPVIAGAVISASHNPYQDNGIKFFSHKGTKLADSVEAEIENILKKDIHKKTAKRITRGKNRDKHILAVEYEKYLRNIFGKNTDLSGMRIVMDCANGATYKIAPEIFSGFKAEIKLINSKPDGKNINKDSGSLHPERLAEYISEHKADCGVAFDGDGDRVIFVDENGDIKDGDYLLDILSSYLKEKGKLKSNTLVSTVMANLGLLKSMRQKKIKLVQAPVGDRYVYEQMIKTGAVIGGEQSGHIIFREFMQTGDGILSALYILKIMKEKNIKLSRLCKDIKKYPQILLNTKVEKKVPLNELEKTKASIKDIENKLKSDGRVLVRYSGTENLLRVMIEGLDLNLITGMAKTISDIAIKEIRETVERS